MPPPGIKKPSLPLHLLKELGASDSKPGQRRGGPRGQVVSRKDRRKAERKQGKVNRTTALRDHQAERAGPNRSTDTRRPIKSAAGGQKAHTKDGPKSILKKRRPEPEVEEEDSDDLGGFDDAAEDDEDDDDDDPDRLSDGVHDENDDDSEDGDSDDGAAHAPPARNVSKKAKEKLAQDDAEIAELERKLGMKNRRNLPQSFKDDGLGDLLDGLGGDFDEGGQEKRKRKAEADEWLAQKRRKAEAASKQPERTLDEGSEDVGSSGDSDEDMDGLDEDSLGDEGSEDEDLDEAGTDADDQDGSQDGFEGFDSDDDEAPDEPPQKRVRENPYVAPTTGQAAKYVPPSLRQDSGSDSELAARIRRQTQGLVNRITESNLLSIMTDIEKLYRENPRQHVTTSLVDLLLIQVCDPTSLPDTLLILTAGFATAAYMVLGTDFGGQLIQEVVERFGKYYDEAKEAALDRPDVPKQTSNLITFISELYTFQLIGPNLVFDYIRMLLENLSELNAELLLRIVRMCGPTLRQDDPMALKDIVALIPPAVARAGEKNLTVRTKFMIDTITDLKNNKMKAGAGASAVISEHITRMRKLLGQLKSKKSKSVEPMRMGLKDIQDADKKGKWWLVGASWAGRSAAKEQKKPTTADDDNANPSDDDSDILLSDNDNDAHQPPDLALLAREQGMNTAVRRSIFVAVMSALDYQDAYTRVLKLRLNKERQREVPTVLLRCVGAEQHYNPYYALVAKRLCAEMREVRWAFQAGLWKCFGRMGEVEFGEEEEGDDEGEDETMDVRRVVNTAKMFGALVAGGSLSLVVLKRLNLVYLQKKTRDFVEVMLVDVLLACQGGENAEEAVAKVFGAVEAAPELARGLQWFLRKVVRKSDLAGGKKNTRMLKEGCKMAEAVVQAALAQAEGIA